MRRKLDFHIVRRISLQAPEIGFPAYLLTNSRSRKFGIQSGVVITILLTAQKISILFNDKVRVIFDNR